MADERDMLTDQWETRDRPVLLAIARRLSEKPSTFDARELEIEGLTAEQVVQAADALIPTYVHGKSHRSWQTGPFAVAINALTDQARREVGLWPQGDTAVEALLDALRQAEDLANDPDDKTALRKAGGQLASVSRNVLADLTTAFIRSQTGI